MTTAPTGADLLLLIVLPYLALALFFLGTLGRYLRAPFTYSSLSSQFLENRQHFWALVPFHLGIIVVLLGHLLGLLAPPLVLWWNRSPSRLYALEVVALALGLLAVIGLVASVGRRLSSSRVRTVTTALDWIVVSVLLVQCALGVSVAVLHPWGSSWFAAIGAPYLWSLFTLRPSLGLVSALPLIVKTHIALAFLVVGLVPFTRLAHVLVAPLPYLWRRTQVVRWRGPREERTGAPGSAGGSGA